MEEHPHNTVIQCSLISHTTGYNLCPAHTRLPARNGLVNEVKWSNDQ